MDLSITGKFIAEMRKAKKLTQVQLAEKLNVSEKTISKWECGNGFPDTTLILPLCEALDITANELLSGKKIDNSDEYQEKAEDNLLRLIAEKRHGKKTIIQQVLIMVVALMSVLTIGFLVAPYETTNPLLYNLIVIPVLIILFVSVGVVISLEFSFGSFECKHCGHKFMPTVKDYILGPHGFTTRHLKCPKCGKSSYCKRRLTKK